MPNSTPVLLLVFNRPETIRILVGALREIKPTKIYISQDGPRHDLDKENIELVRIELEKIDWECEKRILFQNKNLGCYDAVTAGIDWFFSEVEFGIILEDDCIPAKSFFDFCHYVDKTWPRDDVSLISGSNFLPSYQGCLPFLTNHSPLLWGWATWRERWKCFASIKERKSVLLAHMKTQLCRYSIVNKKALMNYFSGNYWDADWYLICFLHSWKAIVPPRNQIMNIGAIGIHSGRSGPYHFLETHELMSPTLTFSHIEIYSLYDKEMLRFLRRIYIYDKISVILKKMGIFDSIRELFYSACKIFGRKLNI